MLTDFILDDGFVGQTIGPQNGFVVEIIQPKGASKYSAPCWDESRAHWVSGYIELRGERDTRSLFSICPGQNNGPPGSWGRRRHWLLNASIPYAGAGLRVLCLPIGSEWLLTLSDTALSKRELEARATARQKEQLEKTINDLREDFAKKHGGRDAANLGELINQTPEREREHVGR
jgi:hypothetical protein